MPLADARRKIAPGYAALTAEGERVRLRASINDLDALARVLIGLGCPLEIVNPPELRATFRRIAREVARIAEGKNAVQS